MNETPKSTNDAVGDSEVGARSMARIVRPDCESCGSPATYRGLHLEAGTVYVCEDCRKSHGNEHKLMRQIWPPTPSTSTPTMHPTHSARASQPGKTPGDGRRPKSITNGHCSRRATIEGAPCPDCGGETFRDEGRVTWCRECGWNHSPPSSWDSLPNS